MTTKAELQTRVAELEAAHLVAEERFRETSPGGAPALTLATG